MTDVAQQDQNPPATGPMRLIAHRDDPAKVDAIEAQVRREGISLSAWYRRASDHELARAQNGAA